MSGFKNPRSGRSPTDELYNTPSEVAMAGVDGIFKPAVEVSPTYLVFA